MCVYIYTSIYMYWCVYVCIYVNSHGYIEPYLHTNTQTRIWILDYMQRKQCVFISVMILTFHAHTTCQHIQMNVSCTNVL